MTLPSFESFFRRVNGHDPFPWQAEAAARLARRETFAVAVPTGLGKSAMVDAAIWAAAQGAWRRIAFVVDRRIVVDAVYDRAKHIAARLGDAQLPGLAALAKAIGEVQVVRLRGGVFGDDDWVLYPERLTVALTTVDQLGSRLLFRGYGVSPRRWPMHAGFFGSDTLVIVDEAHLSDPFLQTLGVLRQHGAGIDLVPMSATLGDADKTQRVALQAADLALPTIQQRLHAAKPATLKEVAGSDGDFCDALASAAVEHAQRDGVRRIAVVVNRVATARRCFQRLRAAGLDSALLTGRVRPVERDSHIAELLPRLLSGRQRQSDDGVLVVVATQTIEVGADFDFDALVTECAPLSSLRQRFGRLDRLGLRGTSPATILWRSTKDRDDPVYGSGTAETWDWLGARGADTVDFGLAAMDDLLAARPAPAVPRRFAASLLPTHIQMLAQTGPYVPQPDLVGWLHGPTDRAPEVTLIWRDDLDAEASEEWPAAVVALPPLLREGLPMPVAAVRRWLTGGKAGDQWSDEENSADDDTVGAQPERPVLCWRGPDDAQVIQARAVRPGDTLVIPASYGGCDGWGWAPDSTAPVVDLADACLLEQAQAGVRRALAMRAADGHWAAFGAGADGIRARVTAYLSLQAQAAQAEDDMTDEVEQARADALAAVLASSHPLAHMVRDARIERHPRGVIVRGFGIEEVEGVIETGRAVPLEEHHADVARWAERLVGSDPQAQAILAAAAVHDAGKAEHRMQVLLHGNALAAAAGPVLAKSALRRRDQQVAAWQGSGLPRGFRHEFASLEMAQVQGPLVRHLVATHHGYGRPWLVPCQDGKASGAAYEVLGSHWAKSWADQADEHGPWALARMEWLVRAADARASIEEAEAGEEGNHGKH
ncbi:conserved hypothetical protein [Rubrivivax sp. A210]|uniref:type I-G CRISPR-associated helicase/endonuclease Cas3g n=1 Tax=Rubrivivax sp. A210 TaxID=2772301 RepID=UPI00191A364A|nr:type I-U CRISPR-associated helicase/endonuclease Cas3 [Rubrivivax sp. A210]CAD5374844.1 conserved hypothetical protein [Rubrivivax sp. A210]